MSVSSHDQLIAEAYRITETLQRQDGIAVHLATDERTGQNVLIRELIALAVDENRWTGTLEGWETSLKASRHCSDEHIVRTLGLEHDLFSGNAYLISSSTARDTLESLDSQTTSNPDLVIKLMLSIACAIRDLAQAGVTHRDIKPANIVIDDESIKLSGLDIAQLASDATARRSSEPHPGTPAYKSPEQSMFTGLLDQRSDIYSLGLVAYEMLTGKLYAQDHQPPHVHNTTMPQSLSSVVMRCLEKDPEERYQTTDGLIRDLERVSHESVWGQLGITLRPLANQHVWQASALLLLLIIAAIWIRTGMTRSQPKVVENAIGVQFTSTPKAQISTLPETVATVQETLAVEQDAYEPDDESPTQLITGQLQAHTFSHPGDVDRATIQVTQGWTYVVAASGLSEGVDTLLEVLADGQSYINDNGISDSLASRVEFTAMTDSIALITITNKGEYGKDMGYYLSAQQLPPTEPTSGIQPAALASRTPLPTYTPRPSITSTTLAQKTPTVVKSATPTITRTPTRTPTPSLTPTPSHTPTITPTATPYRTSLPVRTIGPVQE